MKQFFLLIAMMAMLTGCATTTPNHFIDRSVGIASPEDYAILAEGVNRLLPADSLLVRLGASPSDDFGFVLMKKGIFLQEKQYSKTGWFVILGKIASQRDTIIRNVFDGVIDTITTCTVMQEVFHAPAEGSYLPDFGWADSRFLGCVFLDSNPERMGLEHFQKVLAQEYNHAMLLLALSRKGKFFDDYSNQEAEIIDLIGEASIVKFMTNEELFTHQIKFIDPYALSSKYTGIYKNVDETFKTLFSSQEYDSPEVLHFRDYILNVYIPSIEEEDVEIHYEDMLIKYHKNYPEQALALMSFYKRSFLKNAQETANPFLRKHGLKPIE